jgi:hypothetical protein
MTHRPDDIITAADLARDYDLTPDDVRRWPVTEYADDDGQPYWLREDLAPWMGDGRTDEA